MPRQARRMSNTGFMHIITRGIGRQLLFEDESDYCHYLNALERYCMETGVRIYAYCLMDNHVHLLIKGEPEQTILLMKKLGVNYSGYFNWKYERVGHLFQDRYRSEPVEDENYLLTVFRYILRNPEKAGICRASEYRWSSYHLFEDAPDFVELDLIRSKFGDFEQYQRFIEADNEDSCLEYEAEKHDDEWAKFILQKELQIQSGMDLQKYDRKMRNDALVKLKKEGLTIKQIERLTGINRNIIQRATLSRKEEINE